MIRSTIFLLITISTADDESRVLTSNELTRLTQSRYQNVSEKPLNPQPGLLVDVVVSFPSVALVGESLLLLFSGNNVYKRSH